MYVREVYKRFVRYAQEDDESWLTDLPDVFEDAYAQVRQFVTSYYEHAYATQVEFDAPATNQIDLTDAASVIAVKLGAPLMGSGAVATGQLNKILSIERVAAGPGNSRTDHVLDAVHNFDELTQHTFAYFLRDTVLYFGSPIQGEYRMAFEYHPSSVAFVDWSKFEDTDDEFIDIYPETHELIVYYALQRYELQDGDRMKALEPRIKRAEKRILTWANRTWPRQRRVTRVRRFL